jgi:acyl-CoA thioester hydrolase
VTPTDRRPPFRFAYRTRVGFDETDAQGIVYYGRYMPYFDRARVEYMRHLGLLVREPNDPEFVMRAQSVEYHAPARFDDELEVYVRVARVGRTSLGWEFAAYNVATDDRLVTAQQTSVQVDLAQRRPVAVDARVIEAVSQFEQHLERP